MLAFLGGITRAINYLQAGLTREGQENLVAYCNQYIQFLRLHGDYQRADELFQNTMPLMIKLADSQSNLTRFSFAMLADWSYGAQKADTQYVLNSIEKFLPLYEAQLKKVINHKNKYDLLKEYDGLIYFLFTTASAAQEVEHAQRFGEKTPEGKYLEYLMSHILSFRESLDLDKSTLLRKMGSPNYLVEIYFENLPQNVRRVYYENRLALFTRFNVRNDEYDEIKIYLLNLDSPNDKSFELSYLDQLILRAQHKNEVEELTQLWIRKGQIALEQKEIDFAEEYFEKAYKYWQQYNQVRFKNKNMLADKFSEEDYHVFAIGKYFHTHNKNGRYEQLFAQIDRQWSDESMVLFHFKKSQSKIELDTGNYQEALNCALSARALLDHNHFLNDYDRIHKYSEINRLLVDIYDKLGDEANVVKTYQALTDASMITDVVTVSSYDSIGMADFIAWANKHSKYKNDAIAALKARLSKNVDGVQDRMLIENIVYPLRNLLSPAQHPVSFEKVHRFINQSLSAYTF